MKRILCAFLLILPLVVFPQFLFNGSTYPCFYEKQDITIIADFLPFPIARQYSHTSEYGYFGLGWKSSLEMTIQEEMDFLLRLDSYNYSILFVKVSEGTFRSLEKPWLTIVQKASSYALLNEMDNYVYEFFPTTNGAKGKIKKIRGNSIGQELVFEYKNNKLSKIKNPSNQDVEILYSTEGFISQILYGANRVAFFYSPAKYLIRSESQGEITEYTYTEDGKLTSVTNSAGENYYVVAKDDGGWILQNGDQIIEVADTRSEDPIRDAFTIYNKQTGFSTTYLHNFEGFTSELWEDFFIIESEKGSLKSKLAFDINLNLSQVEVFGALNLVKTYTYKNNGNLVEVRENGSFIEERHYKNGRLVKIVYSDGSILRFRYTKVNDSEYVEVLEDDEVVFSFVWGAGNRITGVTIVTDFANKRGIESGSPVSSICIGDKTLYFYQPQSRETHFYSNRGEIRGENSVYYDDTFTVDFDDPLLPQKGETLKDYSERIKSDPLGIAIRSMKKSFWEGMRDMVNTSVEPSPKPVPPQRDPPVQSSIFEYFWKTRVPLRALIQMKVSIGVAVGNYRQEDGWHLSDATAIIMIGEERIVVKTTVKDKVLEMSILNAQKEIGKSIAVELIKSYYFGGMEDE